MLCHFELLRTSDTEKKGVSGFSLGKQGPRGLSEVWWWYSHPERPHTTQLC